MKTKDQILLESQYDKIQGLKKFMDFDKDLGPGRDFIIENEDYDKDNKIYILSFIAKDDHYEARYTFEWALEEPEMELISLKRFSDSEYTSLDAEIPPTSHLFKVAEVVLRELVIDGKIEPNYDKWLKMWNSY
jgi:hypothetical protein